MPSMTHRPLRHVAQRIALIVAPVLLAACSSLAETGESTPTTALAPDYRAVIAVHLKSIFTKPPLQGPTQMSEPRWMLTNRGWGWQVCVRFQDRGQQRTYAIYFKGKEFLDERYAVRTDACDTQTYYEFDLGSGGMRPGDPGPLY